MKIALMYLKASNLGDQIIYETAKHIIGDIIQRNHAECELIPVDMGSYLVKREGGKEPPAVLSIASKAKRVMSRIVNSRFFSHAFPRSAKRFLKWQWRLTNVYAFYEKNERMKLFDVDAIVFCGGGLVKYHRQNFHYFIDDITQIAQERKIPVLFNAVGVEGYSESSLECQILKEALNRDCVAYISTRDDEDTLRNCYIENPNIVIEQVCDPAFWIAETYGIAKEKQESRIIGLNVIRPNIFREYLYDVSRSELGELYRGLIERVSSMGYGVELFSNGLAADGRFIEWLLATYPDLKEHCHVKVTTPKTTEELVRTIAGYDRFLAVRLHASIVGSVLGIPNVSLVWNQKQMMFGRLIGMEKNYIQKQEFVAESVFERLMAAKPYKMDAVYKNSVYLGLEKQLTALWAEEESTH